ncbi:MAG TPA: DNA-protecting protein DprA [Ruminococcus sp.]|nr:DNA-protecting protein DprA [Ruminococcus sp.]
MISSNKRIWIWITQVLGYNTPKVRRIYELYSDINDFYNGGEREWRFCGIFSQNDISKLRNTDISAADKIISRCNELKYSVLAIDDEKYPQCLRDIECPPAVIYVSGKLPDVDNRLTIGIVGTRRATKYGIDNSYKFGYALSKYGVATVSGGALGVDCASHRGSLAADGVTICVRGCGINASYLSENAGMRNAITKKGAVISEYPPDETPRTYYFPARNRIIAALSDGVLIIESGIKSGSLITANLAGEMGKKVYALLGNNNPQNEGSNERIKDGTAIPVTDFMDILTSFDNLYATSDKIDFNNLSLEDIEAVPVKGMSNLKKKKLKNNLTSTISYEKNNKKIYCETENDNSTNEIKHKENLNLNTTAQSVYDYIGNEPVHIDKIAADLNIPVFKVLASLTILEMKGLIQALQGRRYILK